MLFGVSPEFIERVLAWRAALPVMGYDSEKVRQDCDGRFIKWDEYGRYSDYGWQIDHAVPTALGGADTPTNKRARHWQGNSSSGGLLGVLIERNRR